MSGDTIFALASAAGRSGVAVVRISGSDAASAARLFGFVLPAPRRAALRAFRDDGELVDRGLVVWFPAPGSYTGEDVVELHVHGGRAVLERTMGVLARCPGWRHAEPGEFTRRAFLAGRLDLTAAEAVNDLVVAQTEAQRQAALVQLEGGLARRLDEWAEQIQYLRAHIEAWIDFPDEEIPETAVNAALDGLCRMRLEMETFADDGRRGERLRDGLRVAVVGPPNAGKSSLVNWLAGRDAAIVSEHAGTTRDVIEVHLDLAGFPVIVADTAGLRTARDSIEAEGVRRAQDWADHADLRVLVFDATGDHHRETVVFPESDLVVFNKIDLDPAFEAPRPAHATSVRSGAGLQPFLRSLTTLARERMDVAGRPVLTRARHRAALLATIGHLAAAQADLERGAGLEIVAEHARAGADALGRVTGRVDVEQLLDVIFRDFCIGK
ncbi:MAG: tRNA uridine-5-carboxymethylaminomethyl(34) synthesis GTPase MnmE [Alphaproteobacteria bacterium]|nr:tRNA uridine-5-carboxymethylaminomethyl(34) synthesis GTPase MnmE [Alphaproteobacteria bacterium]